MVEFEAPDLLTQIHGLNEAQRHTLPFGCIRLARDGQVTFYSRREAELSGYGSRPAVGLNFFTSIAPCMNTPRIRGLLEAEIARGLYVSNQTSAVESGGR